MSDQPEYTEDQLAAAKASVAAPPVGTGPDPADLQAKLTGASPFEVDTQAMIRALVEAEVKRLMAQQTRPEGEHALVSDAAAARELIAKHFEFHPKKDELLRLADDLTDAAKNSVASGDSGPTRQLAARLERRLGFFHPGPGDHHYFRQALGLLQVHMPDHADTITEPAPSDAPAVTSAQAPARVLQGSVTG